MPSLYEAYAVSVGDGLKLIPSPGLNREKRLVLSSPGASPLRSATLISAELYRPASVSVHASLNASVSRKNTPR